MIHLAMLEVDEKGSSATWGAHVTDEEYAAAAADQHLMLPRATGSRVPPHARSLAEPRGTCSRVASWSSRQATDARQTNAIMTRNE